MYAVGLVAEQEARGDHFFDFFDFEDDNLFTHAWFSFVLG